MKKYIALTLCVSLFSAATFLTFGQGSSPTPTPPAYRGNLAGTPQVTTVTLNTGYQPTTDQAGTLRHNLGGVVGTGTNTYVNGYPTDQTVTSGDNAFITATPGLVVRSATSVKIILSSTDAFIITASGTGAGIAHISGTNYNQLLP